MKFELCRRGSLILEGLDAEEDEAQPEGAMYEQIEQDLEMMASAATEEDFLLLLL